MTSESPQGILLIDKPLHITSFGVIAVLRRLTKVKKIGHCGTLDPLASGLLVCLIGKNYTRKSDALTADDKSYIASIELGSATTTFDKEGEKTHTSDLVPSKDDILNAIAKFQGQTLQTPPIFSAKKIGGQKACDLARQGKSVEMKPSLVNMQLDLVEYNYPHLIVKAKVSKGTYIRSLAHDLGLYLKTFAHLSALRRIECGTFSIDQAISLDKLKLEPELITQYIKL
jgi:tRNA pseudouridine55 synthase